MFSSNNEKIMKLKNEYIDRINKNAIKLNKQLRFLMKIQNQIGGATQDSTPVVPESGDTANPSSDRVGLLAKAMINSAVMSSSLEQQGNKANQLNENLKGLTKSIEDLIGRQEQNISKITNLGQDLSRVTNPVEGLTPEQKQKMDNYLVDPINQSKSNEQKIQEITQLISTQSDSTQSIPQQTGVTPSGTGVTPSGTGVTPSGTGVTSQQTDEASQRPVVSPQETGPTPRIQLQQIAGLDNTSLTKEGKFSNVIQINGRPATSLGYRYLREQVEKLNEPRNKQTIEQKLSQQDIETLNNILLAINGNQLNDAGATEIERLFKLTGLR